MKLKIKDLRSKFLLVFSLFTVVFSDIVLGIPYQYIRTKTAATDTDPESTTLEDGISDMTIEAKWRFFEKEGFSFALKPGITLPTGDRKRGLGTGRTAYSMFFVTKPETDFTVLAGITLRF